MMELVTFTIFAFFPGIHYIHSLLVFLFLWISCSTTEIAILLFLVFKPHGIPCFYIHNWIFMSMEMERTGKTSSKKVVCTIKKLCIVWIKTNNNSKWLFYHYFWPFSCQLYVYLSQNWSSDGHFDKLNRSKIWLVLMLWHKR